MMRRWVPRHQDAIAILALALVAMAAGRSARPPAAPEVTYTLRLPEPAHRWMEVEAVFPGLGTAPAGIRMSAASPGRYARHEFAKNVIDVRVYDSAGHELSFIRPNPHQWDISGHDGTVRVRYRVFGDRLDGTYLAIDSTHAHVNMPAALMWMHGLEERPVRVRFERPPGRSWQVATQLYPTGDPLSFTAPNLQYLMDSPAEFSDFTLRQFTVTDPSRPGRRPVFRVAVHHHGSDADVDAFAREIRQIVEEAVRVFGEFPDFETGAYTVIADYVPDAAADAMEHRNSTVLTAPASLSGAGQRAWLQDSVAHELVHAWNVERIRPDSLEPFDFEEPNISGELWLGEGFTSYYGHRLMRHTGFADLDETLEHFAYAINIVSFSPGRQLGSAVTMSRLAPFTDAASFIDRTAWENTYISYYTWGEALALGLDLLLRERSAGRLTLDDYMRAMWRKYGKPGGRPGYVAVPYTLEDARSTLAEVARDARFAAEFFRRYVEGREVVDYERLVRQAGLVLRKRAPGRAWWGDVSLSAGADGVRVTSPTLFGSPLYRAGIDRGDVLVAVDGRPLTSETQWAALLAERRPGEAIRVATLRGRARMEATVTLDEEPRLELVPLERAGGSPSAAQLAFREAWLGGRTNR